MKKMTSVLFLLLSVALFSQAAFNYDVTWRLSQLPFQPPQAASQVAMVKAGFDTDQDGKGEFIIAYTDMETNHIMMYEATGDNAFELVWSWQYPNAGATFAGFVIADLDGNGLPEIVTTFPTNLSLSPNPDRLWVFEWNGVVGENKYGIYNGADPEPHLAWNLGLPDNMDYRPYSLVAEDIDGDGHQELIIGNRHSTAGLLREVRVASLSGTVAGFSNWDIEYTLSGLTGGSLYSVTTGDLDNDGKKEIYAFIWNFFTMYIIEATGPNQYALVDSLQLVTQGLEDHGALDGVRVADVNGDGINEMYIAGTEGSNTIFVISNITDVSQIQASDVKVLMTLPRVNEGRLRALWIADMDGDGRQSLMVAGERNGRIYDIKYKGVGDPTDSSSWDINIAYDIWAHSGIAPTASPTLTPRLFYGCPTGDMDGDGRREYVFINYSSDFDVWAEDAYAFVIENPTVVSSVEKGEVELSGYTLAQNYPNPFNPVTTIEFSLPEAGQTKLSVVNMLGEEVAVLVNEYRTSGNHKIMYNASNLSSGVYLYRLAVNNHVSTKKLILMK